MSVCLKYQNVLTRPRFRTEVAQWPAFDGLALNSSMLYEWVFLAGSLPIIFYAAWRGEHCVLMLLADRSLHYWVYRRCVLWFWICSVNGR